MAVSPLTVWRRAVLVFAPRQLKLVALAMSEFVRTRAGEIGDARPGHSVLMKALGYVEPSTLRRHIADLARHGWIEIVAAHAPGRAATYRPAFPPDLAQEALVELENPSEGMWSRLIELRDAAELGAHGTPPANSADISALLEEPSVRIPSPDSADVSTEQCGYIPATVRIEPHLSTSEVRIEEHLEVRGAPRARRGTRGTPKENANTLPAREDQLAELKRRIGGAS